MRFIDSFVYLIRGKTKTDLCIRAVTDWGVIETWQQGWFRIVIYLLSLEPTAETAANSDRLASSL